MIDLSEYSEPVVTALIGFLYHSRYEALSSSDRDDFQEYPLDTHARMYAIGRDYEIVPLKQYASSDFQSYAMIRLNGTQAHPSSIESSQRLGAALLRTIGLIYPSTPK